MEYINNDEQLTMKLIEDNSHKIVQSPRIQSNINLNSLHVYKFIRKALEQGKLNEPYNLELQLKSILRCVWGTRWSKQEHPDVKYLNNISTFVRLYSNDANENKPNIPTKIINIPRGCKRINQDDFTLLQYCLIPSFEYKPEQLTDNLWNKHLFIFQNIILATKINERKQLKDLKQERLNMAETDEERQEINEEYLNEIDSTKNENVYKLVNHLNWLYYNNELAKDILWRFVLLRWTSISTNENKLDETKVYNENEYREYILNLYTQLVSILDTEDETYDDILLMFHLAVNIYNYQFVHKDVYSYIIKYIKIMTNYIVCHQQCLTDWIQEQINNITKSFKCVSIVYPMNELLNKIIETHLQTFVANKTKTIIELVKNNFPNELLKEYQFDILVNNLVVKADIIVLFNKYNERNKQIVDNDLSKYDINIIEDIMFERYLTNVCAYTPYIVNILRTRDNDFVNKLFAKLEHELKNKNKFTSDLIKSFACYNVLLSDDRYYKIILEYTTEDNHNDVDFLIGLENYVKYMNPILRKQYLEITTNILNTRKLVGWRLCKLEDLQEKLT